MVCYSMLFLFAICIVLLCVSGRNTKNTAFLSKEHTTVGRATMAILIVFSHIAIQTNVGSEIPYGQTLANYIGGCGALGVAFFFFLSGYGNHFSIMRLEKKPGKYIQWLADRIVKTLIVFLLAYAFDFIVLVVAGKGASIRDLFHGLITLSMPGTTTWYLKMQLLYYAVIALDAWLFKDKPKSYLIAAVIISMLTSLPFYFAHSNWWNGYTGCCFVAGIFVALHKGRICNKAETMNLKIVVPLSAILTIGFYHLTVKSVGGYLVQNVLFVCLCLLTVLNVYLLKLNKEWFFRMGKASLPIYLVHIGLIKGLFQDKIYNELNMIVFAALTVLGSLIVQIVSQRMNKGLGMLVREEPLNTMKN